ncbi:hypothetical protein KAF25_010779 [Fusarium avenaceum]|uniref:Protein kinase domain-containing protein n=1 Tax=Fusarium avenaceum TaxID=40199 RepID=A0A9P7GYI9_9HYPO|nr:hypothetical protein KAF25_010779 [Fusarium avenaceum]
MTPAPRYEIEHHITSIRDDDRDARFKVRRNGKAFYISEEVLGDIYDTDVYEWVMAPFEPLFAELALKPPDLPEDVSITLRDHLFPEFFVFALDIVDEKLCPRRITAEEPPHRPSFIRFDNDFLDDLETWTAFYDPAGIILSFKDPEDALFKPPNKVLIDNCQTECFFKPCNSGVQIKQELKSYKMIHAAGLDSQLYLCHMYGVVMDDCNFILGLLLTYIDNGDRPLSTRIHPDDPDDPPAEIRERWVGQLDDTLSGLHKAGIVWGDVKAENVLVDKDNNAWISDFGGGYTKGWVDKEIAGTVKGDLMGRRDLPYADTMDDLIAMASIVQRPHERWLDVISRINSPENVARQQRLKRLDIEIENILKFSRADTQGHVDAGPIKALVREQSRLEEEVERDTKLYEQELQEARAEMNAASLIGAQSTPSIHRNLDIPTPSRSSGNESQRSSHHREDPGEESYGNTGENDNDDDYENDGPQYDTFDENKSEEIYNALPTANNRLTRSISQRDPSPETGNSKRPAKRHWRSGSFFTQGRQIEFDAVFQNGTPRQWYRIVQSPRITGHWYILECTSCSTYFRREDAFQQAKEHLHTRHSNNSYVSAASVLEEFGTVVLNCNEELARRHNDLLDAGWGSLASNNLSIASPEPGDCVEEYPEEPLQIPATTVTHVKKKRKRGRPKAPIYQWKPPASFAELDPRIVNLKPGDIVSVWIKRYKRFEPAMILPWGRFDRLDYSHTLAEVELNESIPKCYDSAESDDMVPRPWAPGYGNIGDLAHRRMLPGLYFRNGKDFPCQCQSSWLALNKLKIFDETCPHTINKEAVLKYLDCDPQEEDQDHHPKIDCGEDGSARAHKVDENEDGDDEEIKTEWGVGDHVWRMGKVGVRRVQIVRSVER